MTPDLDEIRAALTAATLHAKVENVYTDQLVANAPTWLAALVEEVERLRAEYDEANGVWKETLKHTMAERDAALAEIERLQAEVAAIERVYRGARHGVVPMSDNDVVRVSEERDKAVAQSARLRDGLEESRIAWTTAIAERDAALAEVERLRAALTGEVAEFVILTPENFKTLVAERAAALAEVERLRAKGKA